MRKIIIDTDTGSDDAVALLLALRDPSCQVLALTTVSGNVPLWQATLNCIMTAEVAGVPLPPVYEGADRPLIRKPVHARNVHGQDGMGDCDIIHPTVKPVEGVHAADAIIDLVEKNPGEIELAVIGPATNVALAMMKAPETMKKLKSIWTMGTNGFGYGNTTPVSEFNVYADAEAYKVMMDFGVPVYVVGFDMCTADAAWVKEDTDRLTASGTPAALFGVKSNCKLQDFSSAIWGTPRIDLPDAVALGCMLWPDMVKKSVNCRSFVCTDSNPTYGQVIFDDGRMLAARFEMGEHPYGKEETNCVVITDIDGLLYKKRLEELLVK